jgi:hypothetical protein
MYGMNKKYNTMSEKLSKGTLSEFGFDVPTEIVGKYKVETETTQIGSDSVGQLTNEALKEAFKVIEEKKNVSPLSNSSAFAIMGIYEQDLIFLHEIRQELSFIFDDITCIKDFGIAGGYICRALFKKYHGYDYPGKSDIDIFAKDKLAALCIVAELLDKHLISDKVDKVFGQEYSIVGSKSKLDIIIKDDILGSSEKVLNNFDVMNCAIMLTPNEAYYMDGAFRCIKEKRLQFKKVTGIRRLLKRLEKYAFRGFAMTDADAGNLAMMISEYEEKWIMDMETKEHDIGKHLTKGYGWNVNVCVGPDIPVYKISFDNKYFPAKKEEKENNSFKFIEV